MLDVTAELFILWASLGAALRAVEHLGRLFLLLALLGFSAPRQGPLGALLLGALGLPRFVPSAPS